MKKKVKPNGKIVAAILEKNKGRRNELGGKNFKVCKPGNGRKYFKNFGKRKNCKKLKTRWK